MASWNIELQMAVVFILTTMNFELQLLRFHKCCHYTLNDSKKQHTNAPLPKMKIIYLTQYIISKNTKIWDMLYKTILNMYVLNIDYWIYISNMAYFIHHICRYKYKTTPYLWSPFQLNFSKSSPPPNYIKKWKCVKTKQSSCRIKLQVLRWERMLRRRPRNMKWMLTK